MRIFFLKTYRRRVKLQATGDEDGVDEGEKDTKGQDQPAAALQLASSGGQEP